MPTSSISTGSSGFSPSGRDVRSSESRPPMQARRERRPVDVALWHGHVGPKFSRRGFSHSLKVQRQIRGPRPHRSTCGAGDDAEASRRAQGHIGSRQQYFLFFLAIRAAPAHQWRFTISGRSAQAPQGPGPADRQASSSSDRVWCRKRATLHFGTDVSSEPQTRNRKVERIALLVFGAPSYDGGIRIGTENPLL
jgi:hypothetical protein